MGPGNPVYRRLLARVLVTIGPAAMASGVAVYLLYAVNVARPPEQADQVALSSPQSDGLSTDERRELTRQMLKERRENPQVPAEVRPTPRQPDPASADGRTGTVRPVDAKPRPERAAVASVSSSGAAPSPALPRAGAARTAPAVPGPAMAAVDPATPLPPSPPAAAGDPTTLPPVAVNATPEPERRSFAANMFSSISVLAGTAANATGNTVNWVIDLPGRAISAGGRLLVGNRTSSQPPAAASPGPAAPQPAAQPPPKRNL